MSEVFWPNVQMQLLAWARDCPGIRALFWAGSVARGTGHAGSDLDVVLLLARDVDEGFLHREWRRVLPGVNIVGDGASGGWSLFYGPDLRKVDVHAAYGPADLAWLVDCPEVPAPRLVLGWGNDADPEIQELLRRAGQKLGFDIRARVESEIEKFMVRFDACSRAQAKSDAYQFYFEYNLALHSLVRLISIARGRPERLFLPQQLSNTLLALEERAPFIELQGTLYLPNANATKRRLIERFLFFVDELSSQHANLRRSNEELRTFLEIIEMRDLVFNFRDVANSFGPGFPARQLFRSGPPVRCGKGAVLRRWLAYHGIRVIIDLRTEEERAKYPYDAKGLADVQYVSCPTYISEVSEPSALRGSAYYPSFLAHKAWYAEALRVYYASAPNPVLVHCAYGCDRTGILCALVGLLGRVARDRIVEDYAKSTSVDRPASMELFLDQVGDRASLMQELAPFGISEELVGRRSSASDVGTDLQTSVPC